MLTSKNILLISPESWNHLFVSKHHYAIHLAKRRNKVYFLNPPSKKADIKETSYANLWVLDYDGFVKGFRLLPGFLRRILLRNKLKKLEWMAGARFDIIWSFDNSVFFDFDSFPDDVLTISHLVDLNQNFMFSKAASTADFCFFNNSYIGEKLIATNPKSFFVNHGYSDLQVEKKLKIPPYQGVKIGYAGNLDIKYIDWDLIWEAVEHTPQVGFYFAGSCDNRETISLMENLENCYYLGQISSDALGDFYQQMDVLLVAYKADEYKEQLANPHKMMEYLASGKPIVATFTSEYKNESGLINMSIRNRDWPMILKSTLETLDFENDPSKVQLRKTFALNNTYQKQIEKIEMLINSHLHGSG